ncbi:MAG: LPS-assembly protein LptD [Veillonellaceae bacterium]|nr:LPS-assembly protein LptD [Veillonellaceae bacterium]
MKTTKLFAGILAFLLLFTGYAPVEAAKKKKSKPPQPIEIVADEMYFSDKTGELFAKGNVVITQDKSKILADIIRGNDKETEVWVDGPARLMEPLTNITGMRIRYNYGSQYGFMQDVKGKCGNDFISGKRAHFEEGKLTAYDASTTGCPAIGTPDYRVTARKFVIWPGEKMIAYDAKIWIKNFVLYSTPRYSRSLRKEDENEFPTFGYDDPDGYWIRQRLNYAITDNITAYTDLTYYSRAGFKPDFGIVDEEEDYSFRLITGHFKDSNSRRIRKEPELQFNWNQKPIGKSGWNYYFTASYGKWKDDDKTSWHQDYLLYFPRNPIYLDKKKTWTWVNGFGFEQIRDSYDGSNQNITRFNTALYKALTPWLTAWVGYNYTSNNASVFTYNHVDVTNELVRGFRIQFNKKTALSFYNSYDTINNRTYENYITLYQNLHCWETRLEYRTVKREWRWDLVVIRF